MKMQKFIKKSCAGLVAMLTLATPPLLSQVSRANSEFHHVRYKIPIKEKLISINDRETDFLIGDLICCVYERSINLDVILFEKHLSELSISDRKEIFKMCVKHSEEIAERTGKVKITSHVYDETKKQVLEQNGFILTNVWPNLYYAVKTLSHVGVVSIPRNRLPVLGVGDDTDTRGPFAIVKWQEPKAPVVSLKDLTKV